jgi:N-acetylglucosaminyl-diphospho-decaprenol L-rhamnosyltransferase
VTRLAVVTPVHGRHAHLRAQHRSLVDGTLLPDVVVVVPMGDPGVADVVASGPLPAAGVSVLVEPVEVGPGGLPLAAARNAGAAAALREGADLVVFLDVDCLAGRTLLSGYRAAADRVTGDGPVLLAGPVGYLPPLPPGATSYDEEVLAGTGPHPARPAPAEGRLEQGEVRLFWSLSFAVTASDWSVLGGFDEGYVGYGGEDTDFAQAAAARGATLWWVGGATALHQWHPVSDPPVEHLDDIVLNANRFHRRWGWFPMEGWLAAFEQRGLARHDADAGRWTTDGCSPERLADGALGTAER